MRVSGRWAVARSALWTPRRRVSAGGSVHRGVIPATCLQSSNDLRRFPVFRRQIGHVNVLGSTVERAPLTDMHERQLRQIASDQTVDGNVKNFAGAAATGERIVSG